MLGLDAVTVTPGSTPPELSLTLPLIEPVVAETCANAVEEARSKLRPSAQTRTMPYSSF
jgi:hypothetical protein